MPKIITKTEFGKGAKERMGKRYDRTFKGKKVKPKGYKVTIKNQRP